MSSVAGVASRTTSRAFDGTGIIVNTNMVRAISRAALDFTVMVFLQSRRTRSYDVITLAGVAIANAQHKRAHHLN